MVLQALQMVRFTEGSLMVDASNQICKIVVDSTNSLTVVFCPTIFIEETYAFERSLVVILLDFFCFFFCFVDSPPGVDGRTWEMVFRYTPAW
jgi:hypothetical protein